MEFEVHRSQIMKNINGPCYCPNLEEVELQFIPNRLCNFVEHIYIYCDTSPVAHPSKQQGIKDFLDSKYSKPKGWFQNCRQN